jgi:type II secretory pathway pseudopilin PulG
MTMARATVPRVRRRRRLERRGRRVGGFTLVELLIAMTITVAVTGAVFSILNPSQGVFQAQPEASDIQQRLRVGIDAMSKDLLMAGAGTYSGSGIGTLVSSFAPVLPYRLGAQNPDPPGSFREGVITVVYVPPTASQTTILNPVVLPHAVTGVNWEAGCPAGDPSCGFAKGMGAIVFEHFGCWDIFTIARAQSSSLELQLRGRALCTEYESGAFIAEVQTHTYYLHADTATDTYQLRHYDGYMSDLPVVDNAVGLRFELFGEPSPPMLRRPVTDHVGPWTTYGPRPPALGVSSNGWPPGENCIFVVDPSSGQQAPRLQAIGGSTRSLVPLPASMLTDGPWCPSATAANRYDADLLRVRKIRVTFRIQAGPKALRGPAGRFFATGGMSNSAYRFVPDQELSFDVTPRNLNLGR